MRVALKLAAMLCLCEIFPQVTIDLNPELAGKTLNFDVALLKLVPRERMGQATFGMGCFWGPGK